MLDELERALLDIAHSPSEITAPELESLQRRIENEGLLFKVRIISFEYSSQRTAIMIRNIFVLAALAAVLPAQELDGLRGLSFQAQQGAGEDKDYRRGRSALDAGRWEDAIAAFSDSAARKRAAADGALYWKAYAQNRAGQRDAALATLAALRQQYPSSRWLNDAQALEVEIHAALAHRLTRRPNRMKISNSLPSTA